MGEDNKHIDPIQELTIKQMQAYVNGTLSPAEQYQVERYLLDHPFEAEAMEGYLETPDALKDLSTLQTRLQSRINAEKEIATIPLWRKILPYAAVFLLLIISTVFTINFFQQEESFAPIALESEDALKFEELENKISPPMAYDNDSLEKKSGNQSLEIAQNVNSEPKKNIDTQFQTEKERKILAEKEPIIPDEDLFISEIDLEEEFIFEEDAAESLEGKVAGVEVNAKKSKTQVSESAQPLASSVAPRNDEGAIAARKKSSKVNTLTGEVLDAETGEPLPGVNVLVKGTSNATQTDLEGSFEIPANVEDVLIVSFIGMQKQEYVVSAAGDIKIFLNPDLAQLSEVVVTGYETEKEEDITYSAARPVIGFPDYRDYLEENLQYPQKAKEAGAEGRVRLKLSINADGSIEEIEVLNSVGDGCDEEAIRLVKEGPKWKPAKKGESNVSSTRKISVRFKIE